jgi:hypothetical protein
MSLQLLLITGFQIAENFCGEPGFIFFARIGLHDSSL